MIQVNAPARLLHLADLLFERPVLTTSQAAAMLNVGYPSAQRYIARLVELGILMQLGEETYGRSFYAAQVVQIVSASEPRAYTPRDGTWTKIDHG